MHFRSISFHSKTKTAPLTRLTPPRLENVLLGTKNSVAYATASAHVSRGAFTSLAAVLVVPSARFQIPAKPATFSASSLVNMGTVLLG